MVRHVDEVSVVEMCEGENRWNSELVKALHEALDEVEATNGPQALVTTSTHPKAFSNGADLEWLAERNPDELSQFIRAASELQARMIGFPMPTIAAALTSPSAANSCTKPLWNASSADHLLANCTVS